MAAVESVRATLGTTAACDALGVSRAGVYRRRQPTRPRAARPTPPQALAPIERQRVLETLNGDRLLDPVNQREGCGLSSLIRPRPHSRGLCVRLRMVGWRM